MLFVYIQAANMHAQAPASAGFHALRRYSLCIDCAANLPLRVTKRLKNGQSDKRSSLHRSFPIHRSEYTRFPSGSLRCNTEEKVASLHHYQVHYRGISSIGAVYGVLHLLVYFFVFPGFWTFFLTSMVLSHDSTKIVGDALTSIRPAVPALPFSGCLGSVSGRTAAIDLSKIGRSPRSPRFFFSSLLLLS